MSRSPIAPSNASAMAWRGHRRRNVLPDRACAEFRRRRGSVSALVEAVNIVANSRPKHVVRLTSIRAAVRGDDAKLVRHVRRAAASSTWPPAVSTSSQPAAISHKADSLFDVGVEPAASDVGHVERGAAQHSAFAHAMHHVLQERQPGLDRRVRFCEARWRRPLPRDCVRVLTRIGRSVQKSAFRLFRALHSSFAHRIVDHADDDLRRAIGARSKHKNAECRRRNSPCHRGDRPPIGSRLLGRRRFLLRHKARGLGNRSSKIFVIRSCAWTSISSLMSCAVAALTVSGFSKCERSSSPAARAGFCRDSERFHARRT